MVVVTQAFKDFLIQKRNVPAEKISVVENGVESDPFSPGPATANHSANRLHCRSSLSLALRARR
jgi:hypothetical protein